MPRGTHRACAPLGGRAVLPRERARALASRAAFPPGIPSAPRTPLKLPPGMVRFAGGGAWAALGAPEPRRFTPGPRGSTGGLEPERRPTHQKVKHRAAADGSCP